MRLTAITLGALMISCTSTTPDGYPPPKVRDKIVVGLISSDPYPTFILPQITIAAPKETRKEKPQQRHKSPCADISTGDVTEDVRARLDCLVKLVEG